MGQLDRGRAGAARGLRGRLRRGRAGGPRVAGLPAQRRTTSGGRAPLVGHRPAHPRRARRGGAGQQALGRAGPASPTRPTSSCRCCSRSSPAWPPPGSPPSLATWWTARSRGRSLSGFVSSRAISRRQEGTLVILPITAAIAVAVFGAGVYDSAATWRTSVAATASPADTTWSTTLTLSEAVDLTRADRPRRRLDHGGGQRHQPRRQLLHRRQQPAGAGRHLARHLEPGPRRRPRSSTRSRPGGVVPTLTGKRLSLTIDNQADMDRDLAVEVRFGSRNGLPLKAYLGPFPQGESTRSTRVPFCREGCPLEGMTLAGGAGTNTADVRHAAAGRASRSTARRSPAASRAPAGRRPPTRPSAPPSPS